MLTKENLIQFLDKEKACKESLEWLSEFNGNPQEAWEQCKRGDWMLWLLAKLEADRKKIVLSACGCARLSLRFNSDERLVKAIETAEAWTRGEVTLSDLDKAAEAARAAWAAARAAWAAARAAWAAAEAAWAAAEAAARAAWAAELEKCAGIVRQYFTFEEVITLIEEKQ